MKFRWILFSLISISMEAGDLSGGVGINYSLPFGDLKFREGIGINKSSGNLVLGRVQMEYSFYPADSIQFGFNANALDGNTWPNGNRNEYSTLETAVAWAHSYESFSHGPFSTVGLSVGRIKRNLTVFQQVGGGTIGDTTQHTQSGQLGAFFGGGYHINRWISVEGTYRIISLKNSGAESFTASNFQWVQVSFMFNFGKK